MPTRNAFDLPPSGRILAIDVGEKTLGLSISDGLRMVASPRPTLRRSKWTQDADALKKLIAADGIAALVVGLPLLMKGDHASQADVAQSFAHQAEKDLGLPVLLWDERLTSVAAERALQEGGVRRRDNKEKNIDSLAATLMLQGVLELLRG